MCPEFKDTYVEEVYNLVKKHFKIGRMRFLMKPLVVVYLGIEIQKKITHTYYNKQRQYYGNRGYCLLHMPSDGAAYITDNTKYHNFFNGSECERVHLVSTLMNLNKQNQKKCNKNWYNK